MFKKIARRRLARIASRLHGAPIRSLPAGKQISRSTRIALEPRMLFDGAAAATVDAGMIAPDAFDAPPAAPASESPAEALMPAARELLVVDMAVENWQAFVDGAGAGVEVLVLDGEQDALGQIADAVAAGGTQVDAVHIVSHGEPGRLSLGGQLLDQQALKSASDVLARIGLGLSADADLLLYGCDVAADAQGDLFIAELAELTGADVAASTDTTGAARLGGDWVLESQTGAIEAKAVVDPATLNAYDALLVGPGPTVAVAGPVGGEVLLGETFSFDVSFDNADPTDTGYAPYVDVFVPAQGADGGASPDGLSIGDATYLGVTLPRTEIVLSATDIANGTVEHPYFTDTAGSHLVSIPSGFQAGDRLIVYELPFGSYTPNQPVSTIQVAGALSNLADVGSALNLSVRSGFRYGADALDNPASDPSIQGAEVTLAISPALYRVTTTYLGPEDETASGPNYQRGYRIDVDIADGQTLTSLDLASMLADGMQFTPVSGVPADVGGVAIATAAAGAWSNVNGVLVSGAGVELSTPSATVPGGTVSRQIVSATGTVAAIDASMVVQFHVPEFYADGVSPVLDPVSGDSVNLTHGTSLSASWDPLDTRDATAAQGFADAASHDLEIEALAIQVSRTVTANTGVAGISPGDRLRYDLDMQLSDFFAVAGDASPAGGAGTRDFLLVDTLSDGLEMLDASTAPSAADPVLTVSRADGSNDSYTLVRGTHYTVSLLAGGQQQIVFNLRSTVGTGVGQVLVGDLYDVDNTQNRATTALLSFEARVLDSYRVAPPDDNGNPVSGSTQLALNEGDVVLASATVEATVLDASLDPDASGLQGESDDTSVLDRIDAEAVSIAIVGRNGLTVVNDPGNPIRVEPGDDVTYRIAYTVPTGDFENFQLDAYLPLPIFSADDPLAAGGGSAWSQVGSFSTTPGAGQYAIRATGGDGVPLGATAASVLAGANGIRFDFGDRSDSADLPLTIEVFMTVRASDAPFADGLYLAAQAEQVGASTANSPMSTQAIDRLVVAEPQLSVYKGVVQDDVVEASSIYDPAYSPSNPTGLVRSAGDTSANPLTGVLASAAVANLNTDVGNVDAGDQVRFAIVLSNTGSSSAGAYDVQLSDNLSAAVDPASVQNLRIVRGDGTVLNPITELRHVGGTAIVSEADALTGLLGAGLELIDPEEATPGAGGALAGTFDSGGSPVAAGANVLVVTYDATMRADVPVDTSFSSSATVSNFAGAEAGPDHTTTDLSDAAVISTPLPAVSKTIVSTDQTFTADDNGASPGLGDVVVGEVITYEIVLSVPEGTVSAASFRDTLDAGRLSFVSLDSLSASAGVSFDSGAVFTSTTPTDAGTGGQANRVTFNFGTITNANTDNAQLDTITLRYRAVVTDTSPVQDGVLLNNSARLSGSDFSNITVSAPTMRVVEPAITIVNSASSSTVDAGDTVTYTITLNSNGGSPAFDVVLADSVPTGMSYVAASLTQTGGPVADSLSEAAGTISGTWSQLASGQVVTLTFQATVDTGVAIDATLDHTASSTWTSLAGVQSDISPLSATTDTERTGAGGIDDYAVSDNAPVSIQAQVPLLDLVASSEAGSSATTLVPGEVARLRMVVQLPESTATGFELRPQLPGGLRYINDGATTIGFIANGGGSGIDSTTISGVSLDISGGGADPSTVAAIAPVMALPGAAIVDGGGAAILAGTVLASGADPVFRLGDLSNTDSDADREFVVAEFNVIVENEAVNVDGAVLSVVGDYHTAGALRGSTNAVALQIEEPNIVDVDKRVISTSGNQVTFELSFSNSGSQTANNLRIVDEFAGASNIAFNGPAGVVSLPGGAVDGSDSDTLDITLPSLAAAGTVTVRYTATVADPTLAVPARAAVVQYTSLSAAGESLATGVEDTAGSASTVTSSTTGERTGNMADYGAAANSYQDSDDAGLGVISGQLWDDTLVPNNSIDGAPAENLLAGIAVELREAGANSVLGDGDDVISSATTDAQGRYLFGMLASGSYRVSVPTAPTDPASGVLDLAFERTVSGAPRDGQVDIGLAEAQNTAINDFGFIKRNAAPTVIVPGAQSLNEDGALVLAGAQAIQIADPDLSESFNPASPVAPFEVRISAAQGTLSVSASGAATLSGNGSAALTVQGTLSDVNATLDGLIYQPGPNYHGGETILVVVDDHGNFGDADGDLVPHESVDDNLSDSDAITVTVIAQPDPPVANPDARTTDQVTTVGGEALNPSAAQQSAGDQTDTDPDFSNGDAIAVSGVAAGALAGPVTGQVGSAVAGVYGDLVVNAAGQYSYTPGAAAIAIPSGSSVSDVFTYTITDVQAGTSATTTITITINGLNDPPAAAPDTRSLGEDDPAISGNALQGNGVAGGQPGDVVDTDPDGDALVIQGVVVGTAAGPVAGGLGSTQSGTWGDLVLASDGTYTYTSNAAAQSLIAGQTVQDVFSYTVRDPSGQTATTTITIDIVGANDALVANPDLRVIAEPVNPSSLPIITGDAILGGIASEQADFDIDGDTITATGVQAGAVSGPLSSGLGSAVLGAWGSLTLAADGTYAYQPSALADSLAFGETADDVFTYTVTDGTALDSTQITIRITGANDAPFANPDQNTAPADASSAGVGNAITALAPADLADTDPDASDTLGVVGVVSGTAPGPYAGGVATPLAGVFGTLTLAADGAYSYTANAAHPTVLALPVGASLTDVFSYTVADGQGGQASSTITITLQGRNDPPASSDRLLTISEDLSLESGVPLGLNRSMFSFSDPDTGDSLSAVRIDAIPASGTVSLDANPVTVGQVLAPADLDRLQYVPALHANRLNLPGLPQLSFTVFDSSGLADPAPNTITIDISPVNDPPIAPSVEHTIDGSARAGSPDARVPDFGVPSDPDVPVQVLSISVTALPPAGNGQFMVDGAPISIGQSLSAAQLQRLSFVPNAALDTDPNPDGTRPAGSMHFLVDDGHGGTANGEVRIHVRPNATGPERDGLAGPAKFSLEPPTLATVPPGESAAALLHEPPDRGSRAVLGHTETAPPWGILEPDAQASLDQLLMASHETGVLSPIALIGEKPVEEPLPSAKTKGQGVRSGAEEASDEDCEKPKPKPRPKAVKRDVIKGHVDRPENFSRQLRDEGKRFRPPAKIRPRAAPVC